MRLELVAFLVAIISICTGKIRHFPRKEERPVQSGDKVATELGEVRSVAMLKVSKMLDKLVLSSRYNNELRPDGKPSHSKTRTISYDAMTNYIKEFHFY